MVREVKMFKKPGSVYPDVVVMDVRDIMHGDYSVDILDAEYGGYTTVYCNPDLEKCIARAKEVFDKI